MPLHPEIVAHLEAEAARGRPRLETLTPAEARAAEIDDLPRRPAGKAVASVRDDASGPVPVRIYRPFGSGSMPVVIYVHGGGFVLCSLDTHDNVCRNLAADVGAIVVSVDYRLAPEHPFPTPADDVLAAVRWIAEAAPGFGGDPERMVIAGDSAGGNLAAVTALRLRDEGGPALAGQLLIYPVTAPVEAGFASYDTYREGFGLTRAGMVWFWDHYVPAGVDRRHPHASPLYAERLDGLPPALVVTVECDVLRDEGEAYAEALAAAGVVVEAERFDGLHHGCIGLVGQIRAVAPVQARMASWLAARFAG